MTTTTALAKRDSSAITGFTLTPTNFDEAMKLAELIASSDLAPKDYKGKPGNVVVAMGMGLELGFSPLQAIQNIAVINGRPSVWGDLFLAVCLSHPDCQDIIESYNANTKTATCVVLRRGRRPIQWTFSEEDARVAGLWGKQGPWTTNPKRMLQMRARGFACRDAFPDALRGMRTIEESRDIPVDGVIDAFMDKPEVEARTEEKAQPSPLVAPLLNDIARASTAADLEALLPRARALSDEDRDAIRAAYVERSNALAGDVPGADSGNAGNGKSQKPKAGDRLAAQLGPKREQQSMLADAKPQAEPQPAERKTEPQPAANRRREPGEDG